MAIVQTQTTSFKAELYQGIHDLTTDVIKIALYTANADLNADTTVYSTTNEVAATGTYALGGSQLTPITVSTSGYTAYVSFPNVAWTAAITARCALIYNSSKGNKSVAVLDFGSDKTSTTTFTITMPTNGATTSLIRSSN
jgi:Flp pilus assembly secretin CpaC